MLTASIILPSILVILSIFLLFLVFGVFMNAVSRSKPKRYTMTPVAFLLAIAFFCVVFIGLLTLFINNQDTPEQLLINTDVQTVEPTLLAKLNDVTSGQTMRRISTGGNATGRVEAGFLGGEFRLTAGVSGLSNPTNGAVYKGWLVKANPHEFFTVGELKKEGDLHKVVYTDAMPDKERLKLFTRFVITIEKSIDKGPTLNLLEGGDPR